MVLRLLSITPAHSTSQRQLASQAWYGMYRNNANNMKVSLHGYHIWHILLKFGTAQPIALIINEISHYWWAAEYNFALSECDVNFCYAYGYFDLLVVMLINILLC